MRKSLLLAGMLNLALGASAAPVEPAAAPSGFSAVSPDKHHGFDPVLMQPVKANSLAAPAASLNGKPVAAKPTVLPTPEAAAPVIAPAPAAIAAPEMPMPDAVAAASKTETTNSPETKWAAEPPPAKKMGSPFAPMPIGPTPLMSLLVGPWDKPTLTDHISELPVLDGAVAELQNGAATGPYASRAAATADVDMQDGNDDDMAAQDTPQRGRPLWAVELVLALKFWKIAVLVIGGASALMLKLKGGKSAPANGQGASLFGRLFSRGKTLSRA